MSDQVRKLAVEILQIFTTSATEYGTKRLIDYLFQFAAGYSEPEKTFQVMFGGMYFETSREVFLRQELPKTLEYLVNLPPGERNNRLQIAMRESGNDPEKTLIQLIRAAQEERRKRLIR